MKGVTILNPYSDRSQGLGCYLMAQNIDKNKPLIITMENAASKVRINDTLFMMSLDQLLTLT